MARIPFSLTPAPAARPTTLPGQCWLPDLPAQAAVALVHGLGEHSGRYAHVAHFLNQHQTALVTTDLFGHGRTAGPRGHLSSMDHWLTFIDALLTETNRQVPNVPVFLLGHSMGGCLVLNYLFRRQPTNLAGVVATAPAVQPAFRPNPLVVALGKLMRGLYPAFTQSNQLDVTGISRDANVVAAYRADPLNHDRVSAEMGIGLLDWGSWLLANAQTPTVPLLLLHGTADRLTSHAATAQLAAQLTGDVTFRSWEGLYHELHNEPEQREVLHYVWHWMQQKSPTTLQ